MWYTLALQSMAEGECRKQCFHEAEEQHKNALFYTSITADDSNRPLPCRGCFKINMNLLHVWSGYFSNCWLCAGTWDEKFACGFFKSTFSFHDNTGSHECKSCWLWSQMFWGLISQVQVLRVGLPEVGYESFASQGEASDLWDPLTVVVHWARGRVFGETAS